MGVLNVTPDSFSDGGENFDAASALATAKQMIADGADIIDIGGESTRPGATPVTAEEEQRRVLPVIEAFAQLGTGAQISVDTLRASTATAALAAGANIINDVSGGTFDAEILDVVAEHNATIVLGHWRGLPDAQHRRSTYDDVVAEVSEQLGELAEKARDSGISPERIVLDIGLGFDKTAEQGWQLLRGLDRVAALGYPVMVGISRKRMVADLISQANLDPNRTHRDLATAAVTAVLAHAVTPPWAVRVHDVAASRIALDVARALTREAP